MKENPRPTEISRPSKRLGHIEPGQLTTLPPPYGEFNGKNLSELKAEKITAGVDGHCRPGVDGEPEYSPGIVVRDSG
jgi:hypothetical protein